MNLDDAIASESAGHVVLFCLEELPNRQDLDPDTAKRLEAHYRKLIESVVAIRTRQGVRPHVELLRRFAPFALKNSMGLMIHSDII